MAKIYRLQADKKLLDSLEYTPRDTLVTEIVKFDNHDERLEFIKDPERFVRKIGLYTEEMEFNGVRPYKNHTLEQLQANPSLMADVPELEHTGDCQMGMPEIFK